tara:strand:+ start:1306 stop:3009 length:1704 start_codon:yes stop_codon:yes gene_type:complete
MSEKKLQANLTISADTDYDCSYSDTYTEIFVNDFEVTNSDAFIQLASGTRTKGLGKIASAKALIVKNTGNICAEIIITAMDWKNSSSVDVSNAVDVGGGGSTYLRSYSMLLPAERFVFLPNSRMLSYSSGDDGGTDLIYESAANAPVGAVSIEPKDINSGNEYKQVKVISGTTYGGGAGVLVNDADGMTAVETTLVVDDGDWFNAGDLLFMGNSEIIEVISVSTHTLTIKRGLLGTDAAAIADDATVSYFFGNEYLPYNTGKCQTDANGRFKQRGAFFGYARTADAKVDGLVAGSVSIGPFYTEGGYLDFGLSGLTANAKTGLAASTTYTFHIVVDEFSANGFDGVSTETAIAFTTDSSDTTWAGSSNAVLPKIQAVFDEQFYTTSSGLKGKKVTIGIVNGDVRITSHSNHSDTIVGIGNVSGTTPFAVGAFPPLASSVPDVLGQEVGGGTTDDIVYGPASSLAPEEIEDRATGNSTINKKAFILDDGNGNLLYMDRKVGWIDYEKGHCEWFVPSLPNAEFKIDAESHSAHSGGTKYIANGYNTIQEIKARSVNNKDNAKIQIISLG